MKPEATGCCGACRHFDPDYDVEASLGDDEGFCLSGGEWNGVAVYREFTCIDYATRDARAEALVKRMKPDKFGRGTR